MASHHPPQYPDYATQMQNKSQTQGFVFTAILQLCLARLDKKLQLKILWAPDSIPLSLQQELRQNTVLTGSECRACEAEAGWMDL